MASENNPWKRISFLLRGGNQLSGAPDEPALRSFHLMLVIGLIWVALVEVLVLPLFAVRKTASMTLLLAAGIGALAALLCLRAGRRRAAAGCFLVGVWGVVETYAAFNGGVRSFAMYWAIIIAIDASWLLGPRAGLWAVTATLGVSLTETWLELAGHPLPRYFPDTAFPLWICQVGFAGLAIAPVLSFRQSLRGKISQIIESEDRFRSLSNLSPQGVMIHDKGTILDANLAFARMVGCPDPDILIGRHCLEFGFSAESREMIQRRLESPDLTPFEVVGLRPEGAPYVAESASHPVKYRGRNARLVAFRDITEQRRATAARRELEERYRTLFECSMDCVFLIDLQGSFLDANQAGLDLFGYCREEIKSLTLESLLSDDQIPYVHRAIQEVITNGYHRDLHEYRVRCRDGTEVFVETQSSLIRSDGRPVAIQGIGRDITARKRTEAEKARLQARLHHANKMESIGRLAGGVAHDFNNVLTVIKGYSRFLLDQTGEGGERGAELAEILKAALSGEKLTRQLLTFSRNQSLQTQVFDVNSVLQNLHTMLQRLVGDDVSVVLDPVAAGAYICADPDQLSQVIMNLAANARDAMPGGGTLRLSTEVSPRTEDVGIAESGAASELVRITISDTGVGIGEQAIANIFDPFFTTKGEGEGTGLGLTLAYGIVQRFKGSITVHSRPGAGTTFIIWLPRAAAPPVADAPAEVRAAAIRGGDETILVVEDRPEVRQMTVALLRSGGYRILEADSGPEALAIAAGYPAKIHLLLSDIMMPAMSGRELAARFGALRPDTRILFMSGYEQPAGSPAAGDTRIPCLAKPFTGWDLDLAIRRVLQNIGQRVLVIDDNHGLRSLFKDVLTSAGYQVELAASAAKGLQVARHGAFDLITTDLQLPGENGVELLRQLVQENPERPVVVVSALLDDWTRRRALDMGAAAVLEKTSAPEHLAELVARLLPRQGGDERSHNGNSHEPDCNREESGSGAIAAARS